MHKRRVNVSGPMLSACTIFESCKWEVQQNVVDSRPASAFGLAVLVTLSVTIKVGKERPES